MPSQLASSKPYPIPYQYLPVMLVKKHITDSLRSRNVSVFTVLERSYVRGVKYTLTYVLPGMLFVDGAVGVESGRLGAGSSPSASEHHWSGAIDRSRQRFASCWHCLSTTRAFRSACTRSMMASCTLGMMAVAAALGRGVSGWREHVKLALGARAQLIGCMRAAGQPSTSFCWRGPSRQAVSSCYRCRMGCQLRWWRERRPRSCRAHEKLASAGGRRRHDACGRRGSFLRAFGAAQTSRARRV